MTWHKSGFDVANTQVWLVLLLSLLGSQLWPGLTATLPQWVGQGGRAGRGAQFRGCSLSF